MGTIGKSYKDNKQKAISNEEQGISNTAFPRLTSFHCLSDYSLYLYVHKDIKNEKSFLCNFTFTSSGFL